MTHGDVLYVVCNHHKLTLVTNNGNLYKIYLIKVLYHIRVHTIAFNKELTINACFRAIHNE